MKTIDMADIDRLPGIRLKSGDSFNFRCHPGIACFNRCCRNLNLFLYPYDVVRLRKKLGVSSDRFLDDYVDVVLRSDNYFPEVLLRMRANDEKTCPFLTDAGCSVYSDRPDTCRSFPVEHGLLYEAETGQNRQVHFFRPPDFCLGPREETSWTIESWSEDQEAVRYNQMTAKWARIKQLFQNNPWGLEGPQGPRGRMAFMAAFNIDHFREFVFESSFLKRHKIKPALVKKIRTNDLELLKLGFEWIKLFVWNRPSKKIQPKK